jgi:AraC-like DNA-binding protein
MAWTKANSLLGAPASNGSNLIRVVRHESASLRFELAFARPALEIRPYVRDFIGWIDQSTTPGHRRQVPSGVFPLIINFEAVVCEKKADTTEAHTYRTFTAGLHERYTTVESVGGGLGLQVNFTPLGAHLYYDRPLAEFTNLTVELSDVIGSSAATLMSQLHDAGTWHHRFQIIEQDVRSRLHRARPLHDAIVHALHALTLTQGDLRVRGLTGASIWGERHFTRQFREHIGLTPKAYARLLRLSRAVSLATAARAESLALIAQTCGYYDQAHFARECRAIAGLPPSALLRHQLPADAGFSA